MPPVDALCFRPPSVGKIRARPELVSFGGHHPTPRERQKVGVQRAPLTPVQHDAPHRGLILFERIAKRPDASRIRTGHGAAGLDFQGHQLPVLFEDEVHFVTRPVAPEMELALERVKASRTRRRIPKLKLREIVAVVSTVPGQETLRVVLGVGGNEEVRHHPSAFAAPLQVGAKHLAGQKRTGLS